MKPLNITIEHSKPRPSAPAETSLLNAPAELENDGKTMVWAHGKREIGLTPDEIAAIKPHGATAALRVKELMRTKSLAAIVRHFKGVRGMGERTVRGVYAALRRAGGGSK